MQLYHEEDDIYFLVVKYLRAMSSMQGLLMNQSADPRSSPVWSII